jgi:hypothetical protein
VTSSGTTIPLNGTLYRWPWTARLAYSGPAGRLSVRFGHGESRSVVLPPGAHLVYVPLLGSGNVVSARFYAAAGSKPLCVAAVAVGLVYPDQAGRAIPVAPVTG